MPKQPQKPQRRVDGFVNKSGYDVMAGPTIRTTPVCPPKYLPKVEAPKTLSSLFRNAP